jgi:hypothetical protein
MSNEIIISERIASLEAQIVGLERQRDELLADVKAAGARETEAYRIAGEYLAAARLVIARWEHGDLAEAVNELAAAIARAEKGAGR